MQIHNKGYRVGEETINFNFCRSIRINSANPVNEDVTNAISGHNFKQEVMIDPVKSLLLVKENKTCRYFVGVRVIYEVTNGMDSSSVYSSVRYSSLCFVDDLR